MPRQKWTPAETADAAALDWDTFSAKYPHRNADSYRLKRNRIDLARSTLDDPPAEGDWEQLFAALEAANAVRDRLSPTQESTTFTFPDNRPIGIAFLGDVHAGAGGVLYRQLRQDLETIRDTDGLYVVGMGDYLENTKTSLKSATALYTAAFPSPREQVEYIRRRFDICRDKWLAIIQGNHDQFDYRTAGIDRLPALAAELGTPYFSERGGTVVVSGADTTYHIVVKHDYTGKSRINKSNSARRLWDEWPWEWDNADVICLAHTHEPDLHMPIRKGQEVAWFRSGTYKVHDGWAEAGGFRPAYGVPVVILWPDTRKLIPFPGQRFPEAVAFLQSVRGA